MRILVICALCVLYLRVFIMYAHTHTWRRNPEREKMKRKKQIFILNANNSLECYRVHWKCFNIHFQYKLYIFLTISFFHSRELYIAFTVFVAFLKCARASLIKRIHLLYTYARNSSKNSDFQSQENIEWSMSIVVFLFVIRKFRRMCEFITDLKLTKPIAFQKSFKLIH